MLANRTLMMLGIAVIGLLGSAACAPGPESGAGSVERSSATAQSTGELTVVDTTPIPEAELAFQPTGQSEPGAGAIEERSDLGLESPRGQVEPGSMVVYTDATYKFSLEYPGNFVFRARLAEELTQLNPMPAASVFFMNPVTASSAVVELEPADLEIRVYPAEQVTLLESWLTSNGLMPGDGTVPPEPFQTAHVTGVEVCSTLLAPGCSYFVLGQGWVYQLTPATLEGETMVDTFVLIP